MKKILAALGLASVAAYLVLRQAERKANAEARLWAEAADSDPRAA